MVRMNAINPSASQLMMKKSALWLALLFVFLTMHVPNASATWKETVKIVVPYAAGGGNDAAARALAHALTGKLAKSVVIENRPGAGGAIAVNAVATSSADGRTVLLCASVIEVQSAKSKPLYDVSKDLTAVIMTFEASYMLYVSAELPVKSVVELVEYDKNNPGKLSYASFGAGSGPHLAIEWLKDRTGMKLVHVPYKSSLESLQAVLKNEVQVSLDTHLPLAQHLEAGKIRAIGTTGLAREKTSPDTPTINESGVTGYNVTFTSGILAPKDTPQPVIDKLNAAFNEALKDPDVLKIARSLGFNAVGGSSARYQGALNNNVDGFRKLISSIGIVF